MSLFERTGGQVSNLNFFFAGRHAAGGLGDYYEQIEQEQQSNLVERAGTLAVLRTGLYGARRSLYGKERAGRFFSKETFIPSSMLSMRSFDFNISKNEIVDGLKTGKKFKQKISSKRSSLAAKAQLGYLIFGYEDYGTPGEDIVYNSLKQIGAVGLMEAGEFMWNSNLSLSTKLREKVTGGFDKISPISPTQSTTEARATSKPKKMRVSISKEEVDWLDKASNGRYRDFFRERRIESFQEVVGGERRSSGSIQRSRRIKQGRSLGANAPLTPTGRTVSDFDIDPTAFRKAKRQSSGTERQAYEYIQKESSRPKRERRARLREANVNKIRQRELSFSASQARSPDSDLLARSMRRGKSSVARLASKAGRRIGAIASAGLALGVVAAPFVGNATRQFSHTLNRATSALNYDFGDGMANINAGAQTERQRALEAIANANMNARSMFDSTASLYH